MQSENPLIADFVKLLNSAAGTVAGMGREAEGSMREKMREWVGGMDFVSREEFEAVKQMAATAPGKVVPGSLNSKKMPISPIAIRAILTIWPALIPVQ